jgi:GH15 family glucan-1,4-alpha-glucosidase
VRLYHPGWQLEVAFNDAVDLDRPVFVRRVTVSNRGDAPQDVRIYFHYAFQIYGTGIGDTVLFDPSLQAVMAYKGQRYFLANVQHDNKIGVKSWATGISDFNGREGTWKDSEDGVLSRNPVAQGSVDGTIGVPLGIVQPGVSSTAHHWLAVADTKVRVQELDRLVRERGPEAVLVRTRDWWRAWVFKEPTDFADLEESTQRLYRRSLLTIRTHLDGGGAIIASTDSDIIHFNRDTYAYCWPRDGALVALALSKAGYGELSRRFFRFCHSVFDTVGGYFLHKFTPAGELASTWHPWVGPDGKRQLPIQEDETGLVIYALWKHYESYRDIEFVKPLYRPLIRAGADFILSYRDPATGLPLPSYDLWEERWGVHAFTVGAVWAGLYGAAQFARTFNQQDVSEQYAQGAAALKDAAVTHLWDAERGYFSRSLYPRDGTLERDATLDSSALALTLYGMLGPDDPMVRATAGAVRERLWCGSPTGGLARYEQDGYHRTAPVSGRTPGNPWFVTTLWLSQYYSAAATSRQELDAARGLLRWAEAHAQTTGLLAEQTHPETGAPLSVSPLTWSHAEFVNAVNSYVHAWRRMA